MNNVANGYLKISNCASPVRNLLVAKEIKFNEKAALVEIQTPII